MFVYVTGSGALGDDAETPWSPPVSATGARYHHVFALSVIILVIVQRCQAQLGGGDDAFSTNRGSAGFEAEASAEFRGKQPRGATTPSVALFVGPQTPTTAAKTVDAVHGL